MVPHGHGMVPLTDIPLRPLNENDYHNGIHSHLAATQ